MRIAEMLENAWFSGIFNIFQYVFGKSFGMYGYCVQILLGDFL